MKNISSLILFLTIPTFESEINLYIRIASPTSSRISNFTSEYILIAAF